MSYINDAKFMAEIQYKIYKNNNDYRNNDNNYPHEKLVELIINIFDTFQLIENIKKKEEELLLLIEEDD